MATSRKSYAATTSGEDQGLQGLAGAGLLRHDWMREARLDGGDAGLGFHTFDTGGAHAAAAPSFLPAVDFGTSATAMPFDAFAQAASLPSASISKSGSENHAGELAAPPAAATDSTTHSEPQAAASPSPGPQNTNDTASAGQTIVLAPGGDVDGDGVIDPGDTVLITVTITNNSTTPGAMDATGVNFIENLVGMTPTGAINISPIAVNDTYSAVGNTTLLAGGASGSGIAVVSGVNVLTNDVEFFGEAKVVVAASGTSAQGGSFSIAADGSFTYMSAAGYEGADSFTYTLRDKGIDGIAGNGDDLTSTATVTINVGTSVWYVDPNAAAGGNGTSTNPFQSLATIAGSGADIDDTGDYIYVTNNATGNNLALEASQHLIGTGAALVVDGFNLAAAGTNSTVTGVAGFTVTLSTGDQIAGINIGGVGGITGTNFGTVTVDDVNINTTGQALSLTNGVFAGTGFDNTTSAGGTNNVNLDGVTGTVNLGTGALSGATGNAFDVNGGNGNVDYNGTITHTANARAIEVTNKTGGTVQFDGTVSSTGSSDGINLDNNDNATVNFTQTLTLTGTSAGTVGFTAINGGTVSATGSGSTINSGNATALNIANTNIGSGHVIFLSISSNGATNGIVLNATGSSGGLHVTGDGGGANNGSGGSILNSTGDGISLTNTQDVRLSYMNINNNLGDGIGGSTVNGFLLTRVNISGNGNDAATDESGINIAELTGSAFAGSRPTGIINSVISNNNEFEVRISNTTGTLTDFRLTTNTISSNGLPINGNGTSPHSDLVSFQALGTANMTLNATGGSYTGNWNPASPPTTITATGLFIDHSGTSGTMTATVNGGTFTNNNNAITVSAAQGGNIDFDILNTTSTGNRSHGLNLFVAASSTGTVTGSFVSNSIGTAGVQDSGSEVGFGIRVQNEGSTNTANPVTVLISGNTIRGMGSTAVGGFAAVNVNMGIAAQTFTRTTNLTITNNNIDDVYGNRAIIVQQNNTTAPGTANVSISGNDLGNNIAGNVGDLTVIRLRQLAGGTFNLTQTSVANLATVNTVGAHTTTTGEISTSGTITFGAGAPPLPPSPFNPVFSAVTGGPQLVGLALDPSHLAIAEVTQLDEAELALVTAAAIQLWAEAGASAEQIAAMRNVNMMLGNLPGVLASYAVQGNIVIDYNAAGAGWNAADLLGTVAGLLAGQAGVTIELPVAPQGGAGDPVPQILAAEAPKGGAGDQVPQVLAPEAPTTPANSSAPVVPPPAGGTQNANIGTVPAGQTVVIQFRATVDSQTNQLIVNPSNSGTVTATNGSGFPDTSTNNVTTVLDTLVLGNLVYLDANLNGIFDAGDSGIGGVAVSLFVDANNDDVPDSPGSPIATTTTAGSGLYSFTGLAPGNYIVRIDASNFSGGGALVNKASAPGGGDPDDNVDNDDNGFASGGAVFSDAITLSYNNEPTAGTGNDTNNTLDFGFQTLNQTPVNTVPGATQTLNEDATKVFSTGNGNAISVNDVDVGSGTLTVTLSVLHGTLTLGSTAGLGFSVGDGIADATITFTGTQSGINTALQGLTYAPTGNYNGADTLTITTNDNGYTGVDPGLSGNATSEQDSDTVAITVTAVNDAPTVVGGTTQNSTTISEDTPLGTGQSVTSLFSIHFDDSADLQQTGGNPTGSLANTFAGIAVTANGSSGATGQWQYSTNGGSSWQDIGAVSVASARLYAAGTLIRFNPALNYNGAEPTLTVHLIDSSGAAITDNSNPNLTGLFGGTNRYSSGTVDLGGTVSAVNDPPVDTVPGTQTINEDASRTFSTANSNAISVADVDAGAGNLTVTLTVAHGRLTLSGTTNLAFGTGDGTADTTMTFTGTATAINTALNGLVYTPNANFNGSDTLTVTTNDNGNTGTPGAQQDSDPITINITAINDAPTVAGDGTESAAFIFQDTPSPTGQTVSALFGGQYSDALDNQVPNGGASSPGAFSGVAVTVNDASGVTGQWQYFNTGTSAWVNIGSVSDASALLIGAGTAIRFNPAAGFNGAAPTLTAHLIDNSGAAITFGQHVDISAGGATGGTTPYSTGTVVLSETVYPPDAAPVVDLNTGTGGIDDTNIYQEGNAGSGIGAAIGVSDADPGDMIHGATIAISDPETGDQLFANLPLPGGITIDGSSTDDFLVLTGTASAADYAAALGQVGFRSTSEDPTLGGTHGSRSIGVTVNDGILNSAPATMTMTVFAVDDAPAAQPDAFTITESGLITGASLFANNGSGVDTDPDGPALAISAVGGGPGANVGTQFALNSGALLTVRADGTFDYNPNGIFLPTPTLGSGASNTPGHDSFTYTLAGGNTVTVSISLTGLDTNDLLFGTAGADILNGGAGADAMLGLGGNDTFYVDQAGDYVGENAGEGVDTIYASISYALDPNSEVEVLSANDLSATTAIDFTGNGFSNSLYGNNGANILYGGGGADVMLGFGGNDTFYVDQAGDYVGENAGGGFDTIYASVSYALDPNSEVEILSVNNHAATTAIDFTGNAFNNYLYGNNGANVLYGGAGADVMLGFGGNDTFYVDQAGDYVYEAVGGGFDTIYTSASYALAAESEIEILSVNNHAATTAIDLTGNGFNNYLYGNAGANILNGAAGADVMLGFGGNDIFFVDQAADYVYEAVGGGFDTIYTSASYALTPESEIEILSVNDHNATTAIELIGNGFANNLYGNAGANILNGGGGADVMIGFGGSDTFAFTSALGGGNVDTITDFVHGVDTISLDDAIFGAIGPLGTLDANAFVTGSQAADASDRIIYNSATGALFYDADGTGGIAAIQFATLSPGLTLTASDFQVI